MVMEPRYHTPYDLVDALQNRAPGARAQLWELVREPVGRLMDGLIAKHQIKHRRERMVLNALHAAETYLRARALADFSDINLTAFRASLLLQVARVLYHPFGGQVAKMSGAPPLPETPAYATEAISLPYDRIGPYWFGGDWFTGRESDDGALWVLIADITGHGYYAYLLASGLPSVWQACWQRRPMALDPAELLAAMHDLLEDCLPDGMFVECTLGRFGAEGEVTVAPAGGCRILLRRTGSSRIELLKLRGSWLGLHRPSPDDQRACRLDTGDEMLLGSDGVFDHLADQSDGDMTAALDELSRGADQVRPLLEQVHERIRRALRHSEQKDDITMVLLRRREPSPEVPATLPFPGPAARNGAGDVSL
jgi:serine phosphatase RsbU (regulator of sigma subunit)